MDEAQPVVSIVDDDSSVRKSLYRLLTVSGFQVNTFCSAQEYLRSGRLRAPDCLILDVRLPGLDGLELQKTLSEQGSSPPIIFITGHGDIPMSVRAMKAGAIDFLSKPFSEESLLKAIEQGIEKSRRQSALAAEIDRIRKKLILLTPREMQVLRQVAVGQLNKQIAAKMNITEKTIKVHRGRVMQKLQVRSIAELVRMLEKLEHSR